MQEKQLKSPEVQLPELDPHPCWTTSLHCCKPSLHDLYHFQSSRPLHYCQYHQAQSKIRRNWLQAPYKQAKKEKTAPPGLKTNDFDWQKMVILQKQVGPVKKLTAGVVHSEFPY